MLTDTEILEYVRQAFLPHRCVAEVWDYDKKLRLRIFDSEDKVLWTRQNVNLDSVREVLDLKCLCESIRNLL